MNKVLILSGLAFPLTIAVAGYFLNQRLNDSQIADAQARVYADLLSKREEGETAVRKDMFSSAIKSFVGEKPSTLDQQILNLEMLAYNFHQSLDLGPLFKHIHRQFKPGADERLRKRVESLATEVAWRQLSDLNEAGGIAEFHIDLEKFSSDPYYILLEPKELKLKQKPLDSRTPEQTTRRFKIEVLDYNPAVRELRFRLHVSPAGLPRGVDEADRWFWAGTFDFPLIDNTRLSGGDRCAIVVNELEATVGKDKKVSGSARISLTYFPASRASLKEKRYYDEVIEEMLSNLKRVKAR